jgi:hypothetical protein
MAALSGLVLLANGAMSADRSAFLLTDHLQEKIVIRAASGRQVWSQPARAPYEAWMLSDGSVVFTGGSTAERMMPDLKSGEGGKSRWSYRYGTAYPEESLPAGGIYTCTPIHGDHVLISESGTFRLVELDTEGKIVRTVKLPLPRSESGHPLRMVRMTPSGTFLVAYFADGYFLEIDTKGNVLREIDMGRYFTDPSYSAYEAVPLEQGRLLVSCGPKNQVLILDEQGTVEWKLSAKDLPSDMIFGWFAAVARLANGNVFIFNYCDGKSDVLAFEVTPDKRVVQVLRDPQLKGLTMGQRLTDEFMPLALNGLR